MPELPEVETTRRGLEPLLVGRRIAKLRVREHRLRWPVRRDLADRIDGQRIVSLTRRGKYLLINLERGTLLVHLGMSGSLRYLATPQPPRPHDHIDIELDGGGYLRLNDPRRFGSVQFTLQPERHPLLAHLGPEPLGPEFTGERLAASCRGRRVAIKAHLMDAHTVVGVGNIYANEALFRAGIHPGRAAGRVSQRRLSALVAAVRAVLSEAIQHGGTTLRDYVASDGKPGYFKLSLSVYDREGQPCKRCRTPIRRRVLGQRAAFYCPRCQR